MSDPKINPQLDDDLPDDWMEEEHDGLWDDRDFAFDDDNDRYDFEDDDEIFD